jgi:hypothetical protein
LGKASSPYDCGGVDKHGVSTETATRIKALLELEDELEDELVLQKQLLRLRRFPRKTTRTWRLMFTLMYAGIIFVKQRLSRAKKHSFFSQCLSPQIMPEPVAVLPGFAGLPNYPAILILVDHSLYISLNPLLKGDFSEGLPP